MVEPLYVNTEGVLGLARVHDAVAAGLGQLQNASGTGIGAAAGPGTTHGLIAFGMHSALSGVMDRRDKILQSTGAAGQQMSEQLHRAAEAYRAGDEQGARGLSSAAEGIPGGGSGGVSAGMPGGVGAAVPGSPAAGGGGADMGQTIGQVGQQAGQVAQGVAQALGQIPGQIAQGVSGVLGGLLGGLGGADGGLGAGHAAGAGLGGLSDPSGADTVGGHDNSSVDDRDNDRRDPERHEKGEDDRRIVTAEHRADQPSQPGQPGGAADAQPATDLSAGATPPPRRPAQTRPQDI
ncbi:hypothetical protein BOO86_20275 [Mycobacterium sp. CBMA 234]|uniref:type VII secretion target n=1 Tax=Mycolicibacterium sp. CBMA 234 TaxID=1918495 RepID=UPI0012DC55FA|nr:type VII secretion target [Mycolicibacterium sp. CBMA 234]MUL66822.1 hypothetical protein [Mycolicibacterium sp. CBMA 234]